eukprot:11709457-Alexandrium_andersonii.AAC.1
MKGFATFNFFFFATSVATHVTSSPDGQCPSGSSLRPEEASFAPTSTRSSGVGSPRSARTISSTVGAALCAAGAAGAGEPLAAAAAAAGPAPALAPLLTTPTTRFKKAFLPASRSPVPRMSANAAPTRSSGDSNPLACKTRATGMT